MWSWLVDRLEEYVAAPIALWVLNAVWPALYDAGEKVLLFLIVLPLWIVNFLEQAVNIFAGVSDISVREGSQTNSMTILDYFFGQSVVTRVFWGITLISLVLCVGFSIIAVIRSMGDLDVKRPVGKVLGSVGRAMLTFLLIPFICLASISLAGVVLRQTEEMIATGGGATARVKTTGALFMVGATEDTMTGAPVGKWKWNDSVHFYYSPGYYSNTAKPSPVPTGVKSSDYGEVRYPTSPLITNYNDLRDAYLYEGGNRNNVSRGVGWYDFSSMQQDFNIYKMVYPGNLLVAVIASWFYVIMLCMIMMVFIRRIYELILLYIVSPFFVSVIPLDEGEKFKGWRERFVSTVIAGFGSIFMIKIFILILPLIWSDNLILHSDAFTNVVLKALLMCGGIFATYKSHTLISQIVSERGSGSERESAALGASMVMMTAGKAGALAAYPFGLAQRDIENRILGQGRHMSGNRGSSGDSGGSSGNKNPSLSEGGGSDDKTGLGGEKLRPGDFDFSKNDPLGSGGSGGGFGSGGIGGSTGGGGGTGKSGGSSGNKPVNLSLDDDKPSTVGTNPFEDDKPNTFSTNPFDDNYRPNTNSTNPFEGD